MPPALLTRFPQPGMTILRYANPSSQAKWQLQVASLKACRNFFPLRELPALPPCPLLSVLPLYSPHLPFFPKLKNSRALCRFFSHSCPPASLVTEPRSKAPTRLTVQCSPGTPAQDSHGSTPESKLCSSAPLSREPRYL